MKNITRKLFRPFILILPLVVAAAFIINISSSYAFELNGFADVSFTKSTKGESSVTEQPEHRNGDFAFGTLDLYLAQSLDDIEVLVELIVEKGDVLDLERLHIGYTFNDALRVKAGRFHTPLGLWNTSYHHGVQLQPTILRPEFLNFEDDGGIIPAHMIGVFISGRVRPSLGAIEYGVLLGNGPRITEYEGGGVNNLVPNNTEDNNIGKAIAFHASIAPEAMDGLKVGISGHVANVKTDGQAVDANEDGAVDNPVDVDQTILSIAAQYTRWDIDLSGEYLTIKDDDNSGGTTDTNNAYYGLVTYSINEKYVPYFMYEDMSADMDDPYFISLGTENLTKYTAGIRYNINYRSSLKGEFRSVDKGNNTWNEYAIAWAVAF